jgi:hypothetical protein
MNNQHCESCFMPFSKDTGHRESEKYCSLCYSNGKLNYEGNDLKEFQKMCYESMRRNGIGKWKAKFFTFMIRFAPRWKK